MCTSEGSCARAGPCLILNVKKYYSSDFFSSQEENHSQHPDHTTGAGRTRPTVAVCPAPPEDEGTRPWGSQGSRGPCAATVGERVAELASNPDALTEDFSTRSYCPLFC